MNIGLDLDNTLIDYEALFSRLAAERGLAPAGLTGKTAIRDHIRREQGDGAWQGLQALAYGERLGEAALFPGVLETLAELRRAGHRLFIISHKANPAGGPDLRSAARAFMAQSGLAALADEIIFASDRAAKCAAAAQSGCQVFIDDLPEVFACPAFPPGCRKIIFGAGLDYAALRHWPALPLLLDAGSPRGELLCGGRNSRACRAGRFLVKRYVDDGRDRCRTEWRALLWLQANGFDCVPEPMAFDPALGLVVMEHIEGSPPAPDGALDRAMADFILRLYARRGAAGLPPAAEACFSLAEISAQLAGRLERLRSAPFESPVRRAMGEFLETELAPAVKWAIDGALVGAPDFGELPARLRLPSPSDFGPHNARRRPDGRLVFFDFEYFGLDDPVKLAADVVLHPGMRMSPASRSAFAAALLAACQEAGDARARERFRAFWPLWRLKWIFILLNEFLPAEDARRLFAGALEPAESRLRRQLDMARAFAAQGELCPL